MGGRGQCVVEKVDIRGSVYDEDVKDCHAQKLQMTVQSDFIYIKKCVFRFLTLWVCCFIICAFFIFIKLNIISKFLFFQIG